MSTIFYNGVIKTLDDAYPEVSAIWVKDGVILRVGSDEEILALADDDTKKVDLGGKLAVPGFCDTHMHLLHFGVFVEDLSNVTNIVLRFVFYLTGVFWNITTRLPEPLNKIAVKCNPIAFLLSSMRDCMIYEKTPDPLLLCIWFLIGVILSLAGIYIIYKNENSYVKVI